jgi:hypothetical protein
VHVVDELLRRGEQAREFGVGGCVVQPLLCNRIVD